MRAPFLLSLTIIPLLLPVAARSREPGVRLQIGVGTVLLIADQRTGLTLWATRATRPGHRPSPDFVGWFDPEKVAPWVERTRPLLSRRAPAQGEGLEGPELTAVDGGWISVLLTGERDDRPFLLAFGHPSERQRWVIEATVGELGRLLDSLRSLAARSRLAPPAGLGYANPTHLSTTPDRERGTRLPDIGSMRSGEVWATAELDAEGGVIAGTSRVLWSSRAELAGPVLAVLPQYRYRRRDGGEPPRLVVYQRFRVKGGGREVRTEK
jgi:hypothetical protein